MTTAIAKNDGGGAALMEQVVIGGDLSKLSAADRLTYYRNVCESVGLNPLTKPFDYLTLSGRMVLYARKDATDQLRNLRGVSVRIVSRERVEDVWIVTAEATTADGRTDASIGAVSIGGLKADALANALMKAETKAKRRVTLSICGLGMLDETEIETIPDARAELDAATGEVLTDAEVARNEARKALIKRCRDAAITLGKDRLKPIAKGRKPDALEDAALQAFAEELEAAVERMKSDAVDQFDAEQVEAEDYEPGGEA
jgi:hypothetical protein